jgi:hypothetical protein
MCVLLYGFFKKQDVYRENKKFLEDVKMITLQKGVVMKYTALLILPKKETK